MNKAKRTQPKNAFELLVDTKNRQKQKKIKKIEETNKLRNTYIKEGQQSFKVVNEKHLRIRKGKNKYVKVTISNIIFII
jgi:hypothetical protein